jgi:hypothetical protein
LKKLNPDKLYVEFRNSVTLTDPILGRKYTLTHSDITSNLFLTLDLQFAYDKINTMRDEVVAEWRMNNGCLFLLVYVYVDSQSDPVISISALRNEIFRRELPLALEAIIYGDRNFFVSHPNLDYASICIHFDSIYPEYNSFENWGTPRDYK